MHNLTLVFIIEVLMFALSFIYGARAEKAASHCRELESFCNAMMALAFAVGAVLAFFAFLLLDSPATT